MNKYKYQNYSKLIFLIKFGTVIKLCAVVYFILNKLYQVILLIFWPSIAFAKYETLLFMFNP